MFHSQALLLLLCTLILCGCAVEATDPSAAIGESSQALAAAGDDALDITADTVDDTADALDVTADTVDDTTTLSVSETTTSDTESADSNASTLESDLTTASSEPAADKAPKTEAEYAAAITEKLNSPGQDIPGAIALSEEAYAKLPDSETILRGLAALLYQSLRVESDAAILNKRRLRLGELANELIERNKESLETLGQMPSVLMLEEAKAHLAGQDVDTAFKLVQKAREFGFKQTELLFYDATFAPLIENENAIAMIKTWLREEVKVQIAETESFPFDFKLNSFAGTEVSLADFKGKLVIVDFWGTWCPPCRKEIPHFVELQERRADQLAIVGITIEHPSGVGIDFETAKANYDEFVRTQPINYPCVFGDRETMDQVPGFEVFPTTLFLDASGRVRLKLTGYHSTEMLEAAIDELLAEEASAS